MTGPPTSRWLDRLELRLHDPLPGLEVQRRMAPRPRRFRPATAEPVRAASVIALLLSEGDAAAPEVSWSCFLDETSLLLTRRSPRVRRHGGQVCLPGGAVDPEETSQQASLRELEEEVGVGGGSVRVLGRLTPVFVPISGFLVEPFVGVAAPPSRLRAADGEVEEIAQVSLARLIDPAAVRWRVERRGEGELEIPYYRLAGLEVWGATAMVLSELVAVLEEISSARGVS